MKKAKRAQKGKSIHQKLDAIIEVMATKKELKDLEARMDAKLDKKLDEKLDQKLNEKMSIMVTKDHFDQAIKHLVTRVEFDDFRSYVEENMYTQHDHTDFLSMMDPIMLEFRNAERVNKLTGKQLCDMDDKIAKFDGRLKTIEERRL